MPQYIFTEAPGKTLIPTSAVAVAAGRININQLFP
jgi:hypothetical protein